LWFVSVAYIIVYVSVNNLLWPQKMAVSSHETCNTVIAVLVDGLSGYSVACAVIWEPSTNDMTYLLTYLFTYLDVRRSRRYWYL